MLTSETAPHKKKRRKADRTPRKATLTQRLLTGTQITQEYGIPYRSVYDLYVSGKLPAVRFVDGGRLWFRRQDVEELIQRSTESGGR
jgi:predicted DNA-binding transcriptional regulator AlpA